MRFSLVLTSLFGAVALATPIKHKHGKKDIVTDIVTDIVYVTVTAGDSTSSTKPPTTVKVVQTVYVEYSESASSTSTSAPPPPPTTAIPTPSSTPAPAPTPTPVVEAPAAKQQPAAADFVPPPQPPPPPPPPPPAPVAPSDYASTAVYHHNIHRANHSAPDVTWDDTLAGYALATAQTCVFAHDMYVSF